MSLLKYRIYGFKACQWCERAKELLSTHGIPFEPVDLEPRETRVAWMDERGFAGKDRTLPKVYLMLGEAEVLVGGYNDLSQSLEEEA